MRSFLNLQQANGGFDAAPLMTMRYYMPNEQYATPESKVQRTEDILRRVEALPGVQAAFASNLVPLSGGGGFSQIVIEGHPSEKGKEPGIEFTGVSPHMLKTLGLSVVRGRELTDTEAMTKTPYAVVNQAMAKKFWPNEDPLGRRFRTLNEADGGWFTIVGVVPDYRHGELDNTDPIEPCAYVSFAYGAFPNTGLTIRAAGDPGADVRAGARSDPRVGSEDGGLPGRDDEGAARSAATGSTSSSAGCSRSSAASRSCSRRSASTACCRTRSSSARRRSACAWRSAPAACDVLKLVVVQGVKLAIVGVVIGVVGSFFVTPIIKSQLVNVSPTDPAELHRRVDLPDRRSRSSPATCRPGARWPSIRWWRCARSRLAAGPPVRKTRLHRRPGLQYGA